MAQRALAATLILAMSFLAGCGGGGNSTQSATPPPVVTPPTVITPPQPAFAVLSGTPADAATDVPRGSELAATLSAAADTASINASSVSLLGPQGNRMPGTLLVSGNEIKLQPTVALPGATQYTLNYAASIKDVTGRPLSAAATRSFTTAAQTWGATGRQIAEIPYFTSGVVPTVAIDKAGDVTIAWQASVNGIATLFVSRMEQRTGNWSVPLAIHAATNMFRGMSALSVVADAGGNVYVLWNDTANPPQTAWMVRYVAATSAWLAPVSINGLPGGMSPNVTIPVVDAKGVLTVVLRSNVHDGLYSTRYDPAAGTWSVPREILAPAADNYIFNLDLAVDGVGNLFLGWVQRGNVRNGLNVARYSVDTGSWSAPHVLDDNLTSDPYALAADALGGATIAWTHGARIMDTPAIHAARFDAGAAAWGTPAVLSGEGDVFGANHPAVAIDASGIATVVWAQQRGIYGVRSERTAASWSVAQRIGTAMPGNERFAITADIAGNVMLLYVQDGVTMAVPYSATRTQWMTPTAIGTPDGGQNVFANAPLAVMDASGNVTAVWFAQISVRGVSRCLVASNSFR
ncbi:Ig-like domain-containing protein [Janthinobacterium lividum]|nr:Ig-like domain-containing protein [Janthinobacterium lividum]